MLLCHRASEAVNVVLREMLAAFFIYISRGLFGITSGYNKPLRRKVLRVSVSWCKMNHVFLRTIKYIVLRLFYKSMKTCYIYIDIYV